MPRFAPLAKTLLLAGCLAGFAPAMAQIAAAPLPIFGPQAPPYRDLGPIAITDGTVIDATGSAPKPHHTILIAQGKIAAIGPDGSVTIPTGARSIDAHGMTVMPGLINSNQHIQLNPLYPAPVADLPLDELHARWEGNFAGMPLKAWTYLMQGVTTMRNTSGPYTRLLPIKHQIDSGELPGPRILLGGALIMSRKHFDHYIAQNRTPLSSRAWLEKEFAYFVVDDIDRDLEKMAGSDFNFWKLYLSDEPFDGGNDFSDSDLEKIIARPHKLGKSIDVHAQRSQDGYRRLLKFDIQTLEHPFDGDLLIDEDTVRGYAKKGILVDTLLRVRVTAAEHMMDPNRFNTTDYIMSNTPDEYRRIMNYRDKMLFLKEHPDQRGLSIYDKRDSQSNMFGQSGPSYNDFMKARETSRENMRRFIKAGVGFAMGTDSTSFLNFQQDDPNATEMEYFVELGMNPMDAIIAATRNGARIIGMADRLGTLEVGKVADVIIVPGDPLKDMRAMRNVAVVIKEGVRYK
jgi:imidazolonepropionase-like amidohydrolase